MRNFTHDDRKFRKKRAEIFGTSGEAPYLCTPNRNKPSGLERKGTAKAEKIFERMEATAHKF